MTKAFISLGYILLNFIAYAVFGSKGLIYINLITVFALIVFVFYRLMRE